MIRIQLLTTLNCDRCEEVKGILARMRAERSDLVVEEIDATSPQGLRLSVEHGVLVMPGLVTNGRFLAMGSITEAALRRLVAGAEAESA